MPLDPNRTLKTILDRFFDNPIGQTLKIIFILCLFAVAVLYLWLHLHGCMLSVEHAPGRDALRLDSLTPIQATTGPAAHHTETYTHYYMQTTTTQPSTRKVR